LGPTVVARAISIPWESSGPPVVPAPPIGLGLSGTRSRGRRFGSNP
jgi:hypothetical protein